MKYYSKNLTFILLITLFTGFSLKAQNVYPTTGNVGIGTESPEYILDVAGSMRACEVKVNLLGGWCDYVFEEDYDLQSLEEVEKFIAINGHLHKTPSAKEIEATGVLDVERTAIDHQEKIEEIFLHLINLNKQVAALKEENQLLTRKIQNYEGK